jgi:hypothetical protein
MVRENDIVQTIVAYIDKNLKKGYNIDELKWALVNQKYSRIEIDKAMKIVQARAPAVKEEQKQVMIEQSVQEMAAPEKKSFWKKLTSWI